MQRYRSQNSLLRNSLLVPFIACTALGTLGVYSAVRADDKQEKKEEIVKVVVADDDNVKENTEKLSGEDRKKLQSELDTILKERIKLDEKIRSLHKKLGVRTEVFAFANGKRIDLPSRGNFKVFENGGEKRVEVIVKDGHAIINGKEVELPSDNALLPHIEAFGGDNQRIELLLKDDSGKIQSLKGLAPGNSKEIEIVMADMKRAAEKMHKDGGNDVLLFSDKTPNLKTFRQFRMLNGDSDARIRELEKRIAALEKRLKMQAEKKAKSSDSGDLDLF